MVTECYENKRLENNLFINRGNSYTNGINIMKTHLTEYTLSDGREIVVETIGHTYPLLDLDLEYIEADLEDNPDALGGELIFTHMDTMEEDCATWWLKQ